MASAFAQREAFPQTMRTWLVSAVNDGPDGLERARRHIMEVYGWPLTVYVQGSSFNRLGDAEDLVRGFFADRLPRQEFLQGWVSSGRRLRFWLLTGLRHYLLETIHQDRRHSHAELPGDGVGLAESDDAEPQRAFRKATARSIVAQAAACASGACAEEGLDEHWLVFSRHALGNILYADIARELSIEETRARVMSRTAANKFRAALRDLLAWPGSERDDLEADIAELLEDLRS